MCEADDVRQIRIRDQKWRDAVQHCKHRAHGRSPGKAWQAKHSQYQEAQSHKYWPADQQLQNHQLAEWRQGLGRIKSSNKRKNYRSSDEIQDRIANIANCEFPKLL